MKKILFILFLFFPSLVFAALPYPIRVSGVGTNVPVTGGVPLPTGVNCNAVSLWDGTTEVPMRATALSGSGNWCLLDFSSDTKEANGVNNKYYILKSGAPIAAVPNALTFNETSSTITVTMGSNVGIWTVSKTAFNLFDSVSWNGSTVISGGTNISLLNCTSATGCDGLTYTGGSNLTPVWEYQTAARATLRVDGSYINGSTTLLKYTTRITWYAGKSYVKIEHSLRNSLQLGVRHSKIRAATLSFGGGIVVHAACAGMDNRSQAPCSGGNTYRYLYVSSGAGKTYDLIPTTSGGVTLSSNNGLLIPDQSYLTQKFIVDFETGLSSGDQNTRASNLNSPAIAYTDFERYGDNLAGTQLGSIRDETATYAQWAWSGCTSSWLCGPNVPGANPNYWISWVDVDIHQDSEDDDLWQNLTMFLRQGGRGYFDKAQAWARYYKDEFLPRSDGYSFCTDQGGYFGDGRNTCTRIANTIPITFTSTDQSYYDSSVYIGTVDGYDVHSQSADHLFGWGLIDYYRITGDVSAIDAAKDAGEIAIYASTWQGNNYPDGMFFYGPRERARHLLILTELYRVTLVTSWKTAADTLISEINTSPDWDTRGFYAYGQPDTDYACGSGYYASGGRAVSNFQLGLLSRSLMDYYNNISQNSTIVSRLISMGDYVINYAYKDTTYPSIKTCIAADNSVYSPQPSPNGANPLTDVLIRAYEFTGTTAYLDKAKVSWNLGSQGYPGRYANGVYNTSTDWQFLFNGDLQYVGRLLYIVPRVPGTYSSYFTVLSPSGNGSGPGSTGGVPMSHVWTQGFWDSKRSELGFVYGSIAGNCVPTGYLNDAWRYSFGKNYWTQVLQATTGNNVTVPLGSDNNNNAYDAVNDVYYTMQGTCSDRWYNGNSANTSAFWKLSPTGTWTPVSRTSQTDAADLAYDHGYAASPTSLLMCCGQNILNGQPTSDSWQYDFATSTWTQRSFGGPARVQTENSLAYEPVSNKFVLFGGRTCETIGNSCSFNDTWVFNDSTHVWSQISPTSPPSARAQNLMIGYAKYGLVLTIGGTNANLTGNLNDSWVLDLGVPRWTQLFPAGSNYISTMDIGAYDPVDDLILIFSNNGGHTIAMVFVAGASSGADVLAPSIVITSPTNDPPNTTYPTSSSTVNISGTVSDNIGVDRVTWSNSRSGSGLANCNLPCTLWNVNNIVLQPDSNILTFTAYDTSDNYTILNLNVIYNAPTVSADFLSGQINVDGSMRVQ